MTIILASQSPARRAMLTAAGVGFTAMSASIDEEAAKTALRATGLSARDVADALAELKAKRVSLKHPEAFVIGSDQTLALDDKHYFDKPVDRTALAEQLHQLSGRTHYLHSAAVIMQNGAPIWRHIETVTMSVRPLSPAFIAEYATTAEETVLSCVGGYRIEAEGVQLFSAIKGSHFAILGLPLLPLLDFMRVRGLLAT